jgi:hypothetical protein
MVNLILTNRILAKKLGENAYRQVRDIYSPERHYRKLITLFKKVRRV